MKFCITFYYGLGMYICPISFPDKKAAEEFTRRLICKGIVSYAEIQERREKE